MNFLRVVAALPLWFCFAQEPSPPAPAQPVPEQPAQAQPVPAAEFPNRPVQGHDVTISKSEQFRVSGAEPKVRGTLSFLAEDAKTDFLGLSLEKDEWKVPISIILHGQQGDPIPKRSIVIDLQWGELGFKLIIHVHLAQGIDTIRLRAAVLTALIYEKSLRTIKPGPLDERLLVRPWLVEGLSEVIDWRRGKSDRRIYQTIFQSGGLYQLEEMLDISQQQFDDSDGAMRAAFRISAGGLMMALLEQPSGMEAFRSFMGEAAQFGGDMPVLLRKHFPSLSLSQKSLEKWWALQMANQSRNSLAEVMTIGETERELAQALKLRFRDDQGIARDRELSAWTELTTLDEGARIYGVRHAEESLVRLSYRCFPSYRNLLMEYQTVLRAIVRPNKKFNVESKLAELEETRLLMGQRGKRAVDYLDWFEITRARETSGVFDDYMKLKQRLDQGLLQRDDHLSRYLDRAEKIYDR